jgi:endonuclease YncB( thermonuclease family)
MSAKKVVMIFIIIISGIFYYQLAEDSDDYYTTATVVRVIDGDTIEIENGQKVRMLGINTPEKSQTFSGEATEFLKSQVLDKEVRLEIHGTDRYGRFLGYVFVGGQNVNEQILWEGFGTLYYYGRDDHYNDLKKAEKNARDSGMGLWVASTKADCIKLVSLTYEETPKRCTNTEELVLENTCDEDLDVVIKDDATHIYEEVILGNSVFRKNFSCIWNDAGDSVYVSDGEGMVLFWRYE